MDQSQNDKLDPQSNEDIISHAMDQFFHSYPFAELMQGFQHLVNSAFTEAQVTIDVREEPKASRLISAFPRRSVTGICWWKRRGATFTLQSATIINRLIHPMCLQA